MKHLKTYKVFESDDWRFRTDDNELKGLSYELDDILLDISDEGFPYVQPSLISKGKIYIEITGNKSGGYTFDGEDRFLLTNNIKEVIERVSSLSESKGYKCKIELLYSETSEDVEIDEYVEGFEVEIKNNHWLMVSSISKGERSLL